MRDFSLIPFAPIFKQDKHFFAIDCSETDFHKITFSFSLVWVWVWFGGYKYPNDIISDNEQEYYTLKYHLLNTIVHMYNLFMFILFVMEIIGRANMG